MDNNPENKRTNNHDTEEACFESIVSNNSEVDDELPKFTAGSGTVITDEHESESKKNNSSD